MFSLTDKACPEHGATTEIKLLPLPDSVDAEFCSMIRDGWRHVRQYCDDYALANVAHHVAAKDAEIEALRAERDLFRAETIALAKDAERLAEALRDAKSMIGFIHHPKVQADAFARYDALLRDQEGPTREAGSA